MRNIENPPNKLYAEGNIELLNTTSISIVGSRACSISGMEITNNFTKDLVYQGITIVSGMAIGIDTIAHTTTLECGGKTIAVLGCGFNNIFPKENLTLYNKIIQNGGLIISEYPPNEEACSEYFLKRNRIVSGLSIGILVIEAAYRSGTSVTVSLAKKQHKKVFCIPHSLDDKHGIGTNRMLKNGAILVTCAKDIIDSYDFLEYKLLPETTSSFTSSQKFASKPKIDEKYIDIYSLLVGPPLNTNEICEKTNRPSQYVNNALFMLELNGDIVKTEHGYQANL